jgi:hypothetical protein
MFKPMLVLLLLSSHVSASAQADFFIFKKNKKDLKSYFKDSYIAFQTADRQWQSGYISKIKNDSFWLVPTVIRYFLMSTDTVRYPEQAYSFTDVYAMPKNGVQIDYLNGSFQINMAAGHQHWYWIKSGWIFRTGAEGYAALYSINALLQHNFAPTARQAGIVAGIFLLGVLLKYTYKLTWRMEKKYHLQEVRLSN